MEHFSCCSRWRQECQEAGRCVHPGTEEIPSGQWRAACSMAQGYASTNSAQEPDDTDVRNNNTGNSKKLLLLIDGNSIMHRSFHGTPELVSPCGTPTNAIYGTIQLIANLVAGRKPTHLAVAMDAGSVFRKKIYPEYKANRKPKDPKLLKQLNLLPEVLKALHIRCISVPNYEADDIIGTMATIAAKEGHKVIIHTGDGDMMQLVNETITVLLSKKGQKELLECTPQSTVNYIGMQPSQVTTYKALAGDSSDNIPGARGIGKIAAMQLIKDYGHIKNILREVYNVEGKIGDKLRSSVDMIKLSLELATIKRDVPADISLSKCELNPNIHQGIDKLYELGIKSINVTNLITQCESNKSKPSKKHYAEKVVLRSNGGKNYCGICGKSSVPCSKFIELEDGRLTIYGRMFWACGICEYEMLDPELYRKIQTAVVNRAKAAR